MTYQPNPGPPPGYPPPMPQGSPQGPVVESTQVAMITYVLFLAGMLIPFTPIVAIIMCYVNRGTASPFLASHYTWMIRTFWIGLLYSLIAVVTMFIFIGFLLIFVVIVWYLVRLIKGLMALNNRQPITNAETWLF